jgi:hypothetical protein
MRITRIHDDQNGESYSKDVEIGFSSVNFALPASPLNVSFRRRSLIMSDSLHAFHQSQ